MKWYQKGLDLDNRNKGREAYELSTLIHIIKYALHMCMYIRQIISIVITTLWFAQYEINELRKTSTSNYYFQPLYFLVL